MKSGFVRAKGIVGTVYRTQKGMEIADPYDDHNGWRQISSRKRRETSSKDLTGGHNPLRDWSDGWCPKKPALVIIQVTGRLGSVYKTQKGDQRAYPIEDKFGWRQVSPNIRVKVESRNNRWFAVEVME